MQDLLLVIAKDLRRDIERLEFLTQHDPFRFHRNENGVQALNKTLFRKTEIHEQVVDKMTSITKAKYQVFLDRVDALERKKRITSTGTT